MDYVWWAVVVGQECIAVFKQRGDAEYYTDTTVGEVYPLHAPVMIRADGLVWKESKAEDCPWKKENA